MTAKICASITARNTIELVDMIKKSEKLGADLIEIRMDFLQQIPKAKHIRNLTSLPLIATNRPPQQSGLTKAAEEKRMISLLDAASAGFEYIDLELATPMIQKVTSQIRDTSESQLIISYHNFQSTPTLIQLDAIFREEINNGADICKIVTTAKITEDNLICLNFLSKASQIKDVICFCMGRIGLPSRLFSPLLGGYMTYASVEEGEESAPGQLTIEETRKFFKWCTP